ncbi:MAG: exopolysaccharide biosynthesis polyprenyl glycosylphosphotransferase [Candidatus Staskawiczbacteria bacterium]|nr:exopolysaccharide biosynthesis polyprenyl glycosylphosphotransferase [Candidatus Staskawiczbacteria bacterium]
MKGQSKTLRVILLLGDIFVLYVALFLALALRNKNLPSQVNGFFYSFFILYVLWILIIFVLDLYDLHFFRKPKDFFFNLIIFSFLAFFAGVTYFYFRPVFSITPKTILLLNIISFDVIFIVWRCLFGFILGVGGIKEKVVIVGFHEKITEILPQLKAMYDISAFFCPPHTTGEKKCMAYFPELKTISEISDLKKIVADKKITSIIFALDFYSNENLVKEIFASLPLTLNYIGVEELYESVAKKVSLEHLNEIWFLEKISKPEGIFNQGVKRIFDIILSLIGLLVFVIFLPFVALAIKIDGNGSVFYKQKRVGKNGKEFILYKFRTMKEAPNQDSKVWREKSEGNITKVGAVLRKLHLDELPQAYNILRSDISFVGPRAEWQELAKVFEKEIPFYKQRYLVKPGLLGWAQINFPASKSVNEAKEKFEYDLYYIKNRSLLLDLEIILKAVKLFIL